MRTVVIGSGSWGTALAQVLQDNHQEVMIYGVAEAEVNDINDNHKNSKYFEDVELNPELRATTDIQCVKGADIVLFIKEALSGDLDTEYQVIKLPDMQDEFMVLPASVALQLLAYYVSSDKGFDVDKPRNLAKVVTVE